MRILFRTDADARIGTGHLMRCLALAQVLRAGGAECMFLCRAGLGTLAERITVAGHTLLSLPEAADDFVDGDGPPHAAWLPGGQSADAAACRAALAGLPVADWLVVDHYALDRRWQSAMRPMASRLMVIDDLADRVHDCDLLLDQNLLDDMRTRYDGLVPVNCLRLLGPRYALLREEFAAAAPDLSPNDGNPPRLLVMFGGADAADLTGRAVASLVRQGWSDPVDVVAGPLYAYLQRLRQQLSALPAAVLHAPALDVASLMRQAALALGSPGVASWERCACGLPTLAIAQADNQEGIGTALANVGAHWYLGRAEQLSDDLLDASLHALLKNPFALGSLRQNARRICDGSGARRTAALLVAHASLFIRRAVADDGPMLYEWRNDERTRRHFRNPAPINLKDHLDWFRHAIADDARLLLIASCGAKPVGCVRFDLAGKTAEVSIYLDPSRHGQGLGASVLLASIEWLHSERPEVSVCRAEVRAGNDASAAMFVRCGFHLDSQWYEYRRPAS